MPACPRDALFNEHAAECRAKFAALDYDAYNLGYKDVWLFQGVRIKTHFRSSYTFNRLLELCLLQSGSAMLRVHLQELTNLIRFM